MAFCSRVVTGRETDAKGNNHVSGGNRCYGEKVTGQERKWEVGVQGPARGLSSLEPWGPGEGLDFT